MNSNPDDETKHPAMVFSFRHPQKGDVLIDSGFDRSFLDNPPYGNLSLPIQIWQKLYRVKYTQEKDQNLGSQLQKHDLYPHHLFITHMHPDHTAGIPALRADCNIHFGKRENTLYYRSIVGKYLKGKKQIHLLDWKQAVILTPFERVLNLFGDGSFWAISTRGHTRDHIAYLVNTRPHAVLIVGDAQLSAWGMENEVELKSDYGRKGREDFRVSANQIREFHKLYPKVEIRFSHDEKSLDKSVSYPE